MESPPRRRRPRARVVSPLLLALLVGCGRTPLDDLPTPKTAHGSDAAPGDTGGAPGTGGAPDTGGSPGTGGAPDTGGSPGTGGAPGTGGSPGTGGQAQRPDAAPDLPRDAPEEPPRVTCPSVPQARPRRAVHLEGSVRGATRWQAVWTVIATPPGSMLALTSVAGTGIDFVPDAIGTYLLLFKATDPRGASDSCQVTVPVRALPPMVFCAKEVSASVDRELMLSGDAKDDDGPVRLRWSVSPATATVSPPDSSPTRFLAHDPGAYLVTLTATDVDGASSSCVTTVRVSPAPMAMCPPSGEKYVRLREATFSARVDGTRMLGARWALIKRPTGSQAEPMPVSGFFTDVVPDKLGEYVLEFVAVSASSVEARCQTAFTAVSEPPMLDCSDVDTTPLVDTDITVGASDNGDLVRWDWSLDARPPGSAVSPMFPMGDSFTFKPDLAGDYHFTAKVTDDEDLTATCSFTVHAAAEEGLRVEMFWDTSDTDMDLHVLSPVAKRWFDESGMQDCYYSNCTGSPPNWSDLGSDADDPHLDIDDTDGFGPENINIDKPAAGVYRVGVHAYSGFAKAVTVRIYCGGSRLEPRATLGPSSLADEQVWKVADVEIFADGRCQVRSLALPGGKPIIVPRTEAEMAR